MTFADYQAQVFATRHIYPRWRLGQTYFNVLWEYRPDLSEQIRATPLDPFYQDDERLPAFVDWVRDHWDIPA